MTSRAYPNPAAGYFGHNVYIPADDLRKQLSGTLLQLRAAVGDHGGLPLTSQDSTAVKPKDVDYSIYRGLAGVALAYLHVWRQLSHMDLSKDASLQSQRDMCLRDCVQLLHRCVEHADSEPGCGFQCGPSGIWALGVVVYHYVGDNERENHCWKCLIGSQQPAHPSFQEDEFLYGRAGYIYSLLFACKYTNRPLPHELISNLATIIINNGVKGAASHGSGPLGSWPLLWGRPDEKPGAGNTLFYLGVAHGAVGILYILLCIWDHLNENQRELVRRTTDKVGVLVEERNALPISCNDRHVSREALVHWCHGIPGVVPFLVKAGWVLRDCRYYNVSRALCRKLWEVGILLKGLGLCHGVCGNAYPFLTMWRLTREHKYLYYALQFWKVGQTAEYKQAVRNTTDPQRVIGGIPDSPFSLMEGIAGVACFCADLLLPDFSHFPGWETSTAPPALRDWLHPKQGNFFTVTGVRKLTDGVWLVPCMSPAFCKTFKEKLWNEVGERRKTDAIRLGATYTPLVNGLAGFIQDIVDSYMLKEDPTRPFKNGGGKYAGVAGGKRLVGKKKGGLPDFPKLRTFFTGHRKTLDDDPMEVDGKQQKGASTNPKLGKEQYLLKVWRAYVLRYDTAHHPSIQTHCDSSDVTFNLCLERTIHGGHLIFDNQRVRYKHIVGEGVLQWGDLPHHTHNVRDKRDRPGGERVQLVMLLNWCLPDDETKLTGHLAFTKLPTDVQVLTCQYLDCQTLASLMYTCHEMNQVASSAPLWKAMYINNSALQTFVAAEQLESNSCVDSPPQTEEPKGEEEPEEPVSPPSFFLGRRGVPLALPIQKYQKMVQLVNDDWKSCYQSALKAVSLHAEEQREAEAVRDREFWMAIIGCYSVHNIRWRNRGKKLVRCSNDGEQEWEENEASSSEDDAWGEDCEECTRSPSPFFDAGDDDGTSTASGGTL
eukprot:TRINITY_DN47406_c0_g1_i1.p1 TRINITY_DN47406_c0_g1~~TRINITY_DN47406_c0_g1_i1.p1  ORF type:complete len:937 (-),score=60.40 TRINITY_DN47406_c0_g1_i1:72-2882(-)